MHNFCSRDLLRIAATALVVALAGCGGSAGSDGTPSGQTGDSVADSAGGSDGSLTLTIDGETTTVVPQDCTLQDLGDKLFVIGAGEMIVHLPPEPGSFETLDPDVTVMLPSGDVARTEDEFSASQEAAGQWSLSGDRASGHVEGTAQTIDNRINDGPASSFSFDFECPYQDISR